MAEDIPIEEHLDQNKVLIYKLETTEEISAAGVTGSHKEHEYLVFFQNIEYDPENESQAKELFERLSEGSEDIDRQAEISSFDYERFNYDGSLVVMPISNGRHIHPMNLEENIKQVFGLNDEEAKIDFTSTSSEFREVKNSL